MASSFRFADQHFVRDSYLIHACLRAVCFPVTPFLDTSAKNHNTLFRDKS